MLKKINFYIKNNKIAFGIIAFTFVVNILLSIYYELIPDNNLLSPDYLDFLDNLFGVAALLNVITVFVIITVFLLNLLDFFANTRRFKYVFGSLTSIYYLINPLLIVLAGTCTMFYAYFLNVEFYSSVDFIIFDNLVFFAYLILMTLCIYLLSLILYKKVNYYAAKYFGLKRKLNFVLLNILMIGSFVITAFYSFYILVYENLSSLVYEYDSWDIQISDKLYLLDNILFEDSLASAFGILVLIAVAGSALYSNLCLDKDKKPHLFNKIFILLVSSVILIIASVKIIEVDRVEKEMTANKPDLNKILRFSVLYDSKDEVDFKEIDEALKTFMSEEGIEDYNLNYALLASYEELISFNNSFEQRADSMENASYGLGTRTYDLAELEKYEIILGREPKNVTEVVISREFAAYISEKNEFTSDDKILGKKIGGQKIVGIMATTPENESYEGVVGVSMLYYNTNQVEYPIYTKKEFNENSLNDFLKDASKPDSPEEAALYSYDTYNSSHYLREKVGPSAVNLVISAEVQDKDFSRIVMQAAFIEKGFNDVAIVKSSDDLMIDIENLYNYEYQGLSDYRLRLFYQLLASAVFAASLIYLTSPLKKGGKENV